MTDEAIARVIDQLKRWQNTNSLNRRALEVIEELQARLAAEQQAHEATIRHHETMLKHEAMLKRIAL